MKKISKAHIPLSLSIAGMLMSFNTANAETFTEALTGGKASLNIRYRLETVEQDNALDDATASTVRTRLGYATGTYKGFSAFIEFEDVHKFLEADYNVPGASPFGPNTANTSIVADPIGSDLNQSYIKYSNGSSTLKYGNQVLTRGNHRFVGHVGWRQNQQTFEALTYENKSFENVSFFAGHIANRNTILFTDVDQDTNLLDVTVSNLGGGKLTGYFYDIAVDNNGPSQENIGLRYDGKISDFKYTLEFATQETQSGAEPDYSLLEASYKFSGVTVGFGIETLGTDQGVGFATPLATLHKFNGWADIFLGTPGEGLEDTYFSIGGKAGGVNLKLVYHSFVPDGNGDDYGTEVDFLVAKKFSKNYKGGFKLAQYSADNFAVDTDKIWLFFEAGFK